MFEDNDDVTYDVVINDEEQYSIWPVDLDVPAGWRKVGVTGDKQSCLDYVDRTWTDLRPRSLREEMAGAGSDRS